MKKQVRKAVSAFSGVIPSELLVSQKKKKLDDIGNVLEGLQNDS